MKLNKKRSISLFFYWTARRPYCWWLKGKRCDLTRQIVCSLYLETQHLRDRQFGRAVSLRGAAVSHYICTRHSLWIGISHLFRFMSLMTTSNNIHLPKWIVKTNFARKLAVKQGKLCKRNLCQRTLIRSVFWTKMLGARTLLLGNYRRLNSFQLLIACIINCL